MECASFKAQYVGKAETAFSIRIKNHRKEVRNPKSISDYLRFRKPGHAIDLHAKFTLTDILFTQQIKKP